VNATVLAPYPLSQRFHQELEARHGSIEVLTVPQLRRLAARALVEKLRSTRGTVVLAAETPSSAQVLPALRMLAALTRGSSFEIASPGRPASPTSRPSAVAVLASVARASAGGVVALAAGERTTRELLRARRSTATPDLARGLLLLNSSPWLGLSAGGAVSHTVGVANAMAGEGILTTVATYSETPGLRDDVRVQPLLPPRGFALPPELNRFRFGRAASSGTAAGGVVYERLSLGSTAGAVLSRRLNVPLVVEYNGSELWAARNWGGTTRLEGAAARAEEATLRHAHLVVTVSEPLASELAARGVSDERIVWHPNGVDPDRFDPARFGVAELRDFRTRYGISDAAIVVSFVGTFGHWHGAEVLARAARLAAVRGGSPRFHFLFVGEGARGAEVRQLLAGLEDVATLAGAVPHDEVPLHLAASDVLVSPHVENPDGSAFFGSPTKLFEYMAAGKAIVASDLDQIGDVLRGGAAILVKPGDERDLLRGLDEAASNNARRGELGQVARQRAVERYTWAKQARTIVAAIQRIGR
jgi:glycosyltransferase involved in cell wall biosynthesis